MGTDGVPPGVLGFVFFGAIASLSLLWTTADMLNAGMVIVNLVAVLWLSPKVVAVLKNYETQRKAGLEPIFMASDMPEIKNLAAWDGTDEVTTREFWLNETRMLPLSGHKRRGV